MRRDPIKRLTIKPGHAPERRLAQAQRFLQYRVENGGKVAGRGIDDPQHLGGRSLLFERLARLGDQPGVLHRDDGLRREILHERNLALGKRPDLQSIAGDHAA